MKSSAVTTPDGILYFIGGQLLFEHRNPQGAVVRKCLSTHAARQAFTQQQTDSGWLAPHTIRYGENSRGVWLMQRYDPAVYRLTFEDRIINPQDNQLLQTLQLALPGMLFLGTRKDYFLWAYRTWKDDETVLYHAPVPNIDPNGKICFGTNRLPMAGVDTIGKVWTLFWTSPFNEDLASQKSRQYPDTILKLLPTLHRPNDSDPNSYPTVDLKRARWTIPDILTQLNPKPSDERPS